MACSPCDVDLKVRGGERRWSVTLSFVRVPRRRPRHRAHQFRSPARGFEGIAARPIRRVGEELVRSDLPLREPVNDRHAHVGVAPTRGGHLHVGDELGGVLLVAGLRHLHLVPLPLVAAVGHIRVVGRLQRVGGHLLRVLQGHGHLAFPSIVVIVPGAPVLVFAHMALLPQQPSSSRYSSSWAAVVPWNRSTSR